MTGKPFSKRWIMDEKQLRYEIKTMQKQIDIKNSLGKDASFEAGLVKAWKKVYRKEFGKTYETNCSQNLGV